MQLICSVLARELTAGGTAGIQLHREITTCQGGGDLQLDTVRSTYLAVSRSRDINAAAYLNNLHGDDEDAPPLPDSEEIKASGRP